MKKRLVWLFLILGVALLMISAMHATGPNGQPSDGPFLLKITLTFLLPIAVVGTLIICGLPPLKKSLQERGILQTPVAQTAKTESKPPVNERWSLWRWIVWFLLEVIGAFLVSIS